MVVLEPFDIKGAAIKGHCRGPSDETTARCGNQGGASAGTAGFGDADAALPHTEANFFVASHFRHTNVGTFGKELVSLQLRSEGGDIHRLRVVDEKDGAGLTALATARV